MRKLKKLPGLTRSLISNELNPHVRGYQSVVTQARREREWLNVLEADRMLQEKSVNYTHESEIDLFDLFFE